MYLQDLTKCFLQILTPYNIIYKTMLNQKFCSLKSFRQFLTKSLLNDTRACETDQCTWFRQNDIPQHRKTCRHAACRRFCQNTYIKQSGLAVTFQRRGSFCHLHQRCDPFLHSGTTGTGKNDNGKFFLRCTFYCSGDFFANCPAHACHQESSIADCDHSISAIYFAFACDNSLFEPGLLLKCLYFFRIPFVIYRISTDQILIPFLKSSLINHHLDSTICMYTEISSAFRTDIISLFYILCDDGSSALVTFTKKSFRYLRPGSTDRTMALYSGNNSCLFEHVIQLHDRSLLLIPKLYVTVHSVYSNTLFICFHSFDEFYICIS